MRFKELYPNIAEELDHVRYQIEKDLFSSKKLVSRSQERKIAILELTEKFGEIDYNGLNQGYLAVDLDQRTVSFVGKDITDVIVTRPKGNCRIVYFDKKKAKKENIPPWAEYISMGKMVIESFKLMRKDQSPKYLDAMGWHPFKSW